MTAADNEPGLRGSAPRVSGRPATPATPPDVDAPGTYQLPARPMSAKLVLPPAPAVLEGRRLLWRDTSVVLVAIAVIGAIIMLLGALGGAGPGPRAPSPESSAGSFAVSPGPDGAAMGSGKGSWPEGACYTSGARAAD